MNAVIGWQIECSVAKEHSMGRDLEIGFFFQGVATAGLKASTISNFFWSARELLLGI